MKVKNIITVLLIVFFLDSCAPAAKFNTTETAVFPSTETSVAQATSMPEPSPTASPDGEPRVEVSVDGETMSYSTKVVGSEATVNVEASRVQRLGQPSTQVDVLTTDSDRFIWNAEKDAWSPEVSFNRDIINPDLAYLYPSMEIVTDGSAGLSALLYFAEHPEIIPPGAVAVQWKVKTMGDAIEISAFRTGQYQWPASDSTPLISYKDRAEKVPFGWAGMFRVKDSRGNEIVVLAQLKKNTPTVDNPMPYVPIFYGFDRVEYDNYYLGKTSKGNIIIEFLVNDHEREVTIVLPPPTGNPYSVVTSLERGGGSKHPNVARLLSQNVVNKMFTPSEIAEINAAIMRLMDHTHNAFSEPDWSFSTRLSTLPDELMNMIVYPGIAQWEGPGN